MRVVQKLMVGAAAAAMLLVAVPAQADSTSVHTFRWDRTHAVRTMVWYDNDTWADSDANGWDDTLTYTVYFRVTNIDTKPVKGSAVVKSIVDAIGGPDETRHSQTYSFALAPGQMAPDQSFVVGPVRVYEDDQDVWSDEWVQSATWHGIRVKA